MFYHLIYLTYFLGEYFYLKSEFSNIIIFNIVISLNIISLFMSLDLIKNEMTFCLTTYFIYTRTLYCIINKILKKLHLSKKKFKMKIY